MFFNELWNGVVQSSTKDLNAGTVGEQQGAGWTGDGRRAARTRESESTGSLLSIWHFNVGLRLYQL